MPVSRLRHIPGIGVDEIGDAADAAGNPDLLRLENLDTDVPPPAVAREVTHAAVDADDANSYLPFQGHRALREAAAGHVSALAGHRYDRAPSASAWRAASTASSTSCWPRWSRAGKSCIVRPDLRRAGQPDPAGGRGAPARALRPRADTAGPPTRASWPRPSARRRRPCC